MASPLAETRRFVALASAEELIANPLALAAYAAVVDEHDDATLLLYAPGRAERLLLPALGRALEAAGIPPDGGPDMLALAGPRSAALEQEIAARASAVYSLRDDVAALSPAPRLWIEHAGQLRALAGLDPLVVTGGPVMPVVMCVWQRVEFLPATIALLARQRGVTPALHLWVNDATRAEEVRAVAADAPFSVEVTVSERNVGGFGRFQLARALAAEHPHVVFIDDDEVFDADMLATLAAEARPRAITAWYAFRFRETVDYWDRDRAAAGERAHYAGTGGMVADTAIFTDERLYDCPERYWFVEDLWLSYFAEHVRGWELYGSAANLWLVPDGRDQWERMDRDFKPEFLRHLVARGWRVPGAPVSAAPALGVAGA